jgi:hypothetical protein
MILYLHTSGWTPPRRRLAVSMACIAAAGALWWANAGERSAVRLSPTPSGDRTAAKEWDRTRPAVQHVAKSAAAASKQVAVVRDDASSARSADAQAPAPFTYVGQ